MIKVKNLKEQKSYNVRVQKTTSKRRAKTQHLKYFSGFKLKTYDVACFKNTSINQFKR